MKRTIILTIATILVYIYSTSAGEVVIANSPDKELAVDALKKIYLGKKTSWSDGSKIVVATLKSGPICESFMSSKIGKKPAQFNMVWKKLVFTGQGVMPKSFDDEKALIDFVAANKGAIGYVSDISADSVPEKVNKILIK